MALVLQVPKLTHGRHRGSIIAPQSIQENRDQANIDDMGQLSNATPVGSSPWAPGKGDRSGVSSSSPV